MDTVLEQLTHQRNELDRIFQSLNENGDYYHVEMATKLAFMWLGKAKGIVGSDNPYPNSTDPSNKIIEAAVDTYQGEDLIAENDDEIAFIKSVRAALGECEKAIRNGLMPYLAQNSLYQLAIGEAYVNVCEAKMFLGLELGELRDTTKEIPAPAELNPADNPPPVATQPNEEAPVPADAPTPEATPSPEPQPEPVPTPEPEPQPTASAPTEPESNGEPMPEPNAAEVVTEAPAPTPVPESIPEVTDSKKSSKKNQAK